MTDMIPTPTRAMTPAPTRCAIGRTRLKNVEHLPLSVYIQPDQALLAAYHNRDIADIVILGRRFDGSEFRINGSASGRGVRREVALWLLERARADAIADDVEDDMEFEEGGT